VIKKWGWPMLGPQFVGNGKWYQAIILGEYPIWGDHGDTVVKVLHYKSEGCWFDPRWCHGIFHWHKSFWLHNGPEVNSASNRNEYQEYFLGVNAASV
jgi:hypothetical protein